MHAVDEAGDYSYVAPSAPGRRGRPRLCPDATAVQVTVTMPADLVARLDATPEGRTRSEKLRILTERGLADIANDADGVDAADIANGVDAADIANGANGVRAGAETHV